MCLALSVCWALSSLPAHLLTPIQGVCGAPASTKPVEVKELPRAGGGIRAWGHPQYGPTTSLCTGCGRRRELVAQLRLCSMGEVFIMWSLFLVTEL